MNITNVTHLGLPEIMVLDIQRYHDERGYFLEVLRTDTIDSQPELSVLHHKPILQCNESFSKKGVIRGLHTQYQPNLDKILRVLDGNVIDVAVDIRPHSPTFGKATAYQLFSDVSRNFEQNIVIPFGFAHGIIALEDSHIQYFQTGIWNKGTEATINFKDATIDWSTCGAELQTLIAEKIQTGMLSDKDLQGMSLSEWQESPIAANY